MPDYPVAKGKPIKCINTHSLQSGGENALLLVGFSTMEIQNMVWWCSTTFMEYIHEELARFSVGMSTKMHPKFGFVNVARRVYMDITNKLVNTPYLVNVSALAA